MSGICDSPEPWSVFIAVLGDKFMKREVARSDVFVYFKTKVEVYLKGNQDELDKAIENEKAEIRVCAGSDVGRAFVRFDAVKGRKKVEDMSPVEFAQRKAVFLEFVLAVQEVRLQEFTLANSVLGGAFVLKGVKEVEM